MAEQLTRDEPRKARRDRAWTIMKPGAVTTRHGGPRMLDRGGLSLRSNVRNFTCCKEEASESMPHDSPGWGPLPARQVGPRSRWSLRQTKQT